MYKELLDEVLDKEDEARADKQAQVRALGLGLA